MGELICVYVSLSFSMKSCVSLLCSSDFKVWSSLNTLNLKLLTLGTTGIGLRFGFMMVKIEFVVFCFVVPCNIMVGYQRIVLLHLQG